MLFKRENKKGFTLLELLVVVLMIGILSSIALPQYRKSLERTRAAEAATIMRALYDSCERWAWENGYDSCAKATTNTNFSLNKLDMVAKGTFSNKKRFIGNNFTYTVRNDDNVVYATPNSGKGDTTARIYFDGQSFSCTPASAKKAWDCDAWNN